MFKLFLFSLVIFFWAHVFASCPGLLYQTKENFILDKKKVLFLEFEGDETNVFVYDALFDGYKNLMKAEKSIEIKTDFSLTAAIVKCYLSQKNDVQLLKTMLGGLINDISQILQETEWPHTLIYLYTNICVFELTRYLVNVTHVMKDIFGQSGFSPTNMNPFVLLNNEKKAAMGWLSLNYALGGGDLPVQDNLAAAFLTRKIQELVFLPQSINEKDYVKSLIDLGLPYKIYIAGQSLGKNEIRRKILMYEEKNNMDSRMITTVCVKPSESFTWNFNPKVTYTVKGFYNKSRKGVTTINYNECKEVVEKAVEREKKPLNFRKEKFYALYAYFSLAKKSNLVAAKGGSVTLGELEKRTKEICECKNSDKFHCLDMLYMVTLFTMKYGLWNNSTIHFYKRVNGFELNWRTAKAFTLYKNYKHQRI
ncbi:hypothetical protein RUM43_008268 [Polyplax serrata]|uniref:Uncharacterized protein n=1 Tax=Polyplax serrata TaxID=468196 RepID=A0AAN8SAC1_POLSC